MTLMFPANFDAKTFSETYVRTATFRPGEGVPIRFSKPLAASTSGVLMWDAWSSEQGAEASVSWFNSMSIWGKKDGTGYDWVQLYTFGSALSPAFASRALAYAAVSGSFPQTYTDYDLYQVRLFQDGGVGSGGSDDNQGGISLLVEFLDGITYRQILPLQPDAPLKEEWKWLTDVQVSYDGTEDRTPIYVSSKRTFNGSYSFDKVEDIELYKTFLLKASRAVFRVPLFQYQVKAKQAISPYANWIFCNPARGDFRVGAEALITEGDLSELVVISDVLADRLVLGSTPLHSYTPRALISPVVRVFTPTGNTINRVNPDHSGTVDFTYHEQLPFLPFVNPLQDVALTTFDTMFVLDERAVGTGFTEQFDSGLVINDDYIGRADFATPWTQGQWAFPLRWQCNRLFDIDAWFWWQRFADAVQGSSLTFLLPSFRSDLSIVTPAAGSGNAVILKGHDFRDYYYGIDTYARLVIESTAGRQFVKVTGITNSGGNDRVTFTPALPAGDWATDQSVGFLLKVRNVADKVTVDHYGLHSEVSMSVRAVK